MNRFLLMFASICLNTPLFGAWGDTIVFKEKSVLPIADKVYLFEDKTAKLTFKDVSNSAFPPNFIHSHSQAPNYNSTSSAIWVGFNLDIRAKEPIALMVDYPMLDTVQLYVMNASGHVDSTYAGSLFPFNQLPIQHNRLIFELEPGKYTVYMRIKASFSLQLPLTLYSLDKLAWAIGKENFYQGVYLGFALLIIIYNLFIFFYVRDKIYLFYIAHVTVTAFLMAHLFGYNFEFLWPCTPRINLLEPSFFGLTAFSVIFSMKFLDTKTNAPTLHVWFKVLIVLILLAFPLNFIGLGFFAVQMVQLVTILASLLMFNTGLLLLKDGYKPARHFVTAWGFFLLGMILTIVQRFGFLPYKWYFTYAWQIGSALDILLLSIAVADRMNLMREQSENVRLQLLEQTLENEALVRNQNEKLALSVEKRTAELQNKNQELEKLNATKDKLFSIVAHDLKGPVGNISKLLELMLEESEMRNDETIDMLRRSTANTYDLLDNMLTWARGQKGDIDYNPVKLNLKEATNYPIELLSLQMRNKKIVCRNEIDENIYVLADIYLLRTILRNLLNNAIKFSHIGGEILLNAEDTKDGYIKIAVADNGVGMDTQRLENIFEPVKNKNTKGTAGEKGTGLGLLITLEFVLLSKGIIDAASKEGQGTIISFTLPVAE